MFLNPIYIAALYLFCMTNKGDNNDIQVPPTYMVFCIFTTSFYGQTQDRQLPVYHS